MKTGDSNRHRQRLEFTTDLLDRGTHSIFDVEVDRMRMPELVDGFYVKGQLI